jgi:RNA polymerase sigma-70 factor (ECF subfamily)
MRRELSGEFAARLVLQCLSMAATEKDDDAFRVLTDQYRRELHVHCYRILGSVQDAEDMVQETLLAAWRGLEQYEERDSLRAWLYRIATNRSLNALRDRRRRPRVAPALPFEMPAPTRRGEPLWLEPYPDALLGGLAETSPGPEARYETKEAVRLAFVAALQQLPPRQRVVLVLRDVLGFRAAEVADMLESSEVAVNSALQRARAALETRLPADRKPPPLPGSPRERDLAARFADAVDSGDIDGMVSLLTDDALLTMPPLPLEYQGHEAIAAFLGHREEARGAPLRVVPTRANTQPAFGCYTPDAQEGIARPAGLFVLTLEGDAAAAITWFANTALFVQFGLPQSLSL